MSNKWISTWVRPREAMRKVLLENPVATIFLLAILNGVVTAISWLAFIYTREAREERIGAGFVILLLVCGVIMGLVHLYLGGWLYKVTSRWLGGKGDFIATRNAVGWGSYPLIVAGILSVLAYASDRPIPILALILGVLNIIFATWASILFIFFIAEAQKISFWRAFVALLIAAVLIFAVLMIISLFVPLLSPIFN